MNANDVTPQYFIIVYFIVIIDGKIIMISISKIKKIIAIMKKWIENGIRFFDIGLNPHSNGDIFCKSIIDFFLININIIVIIVSKMIIAIVWIKMFLIIYFLSFRTF